MELQLSLIILCLFITSITSKQPVVIEPKNPKAPTKLPDGVTKNVLIIGNKEIIKLISFKIKNLT